MKRIELSEYIEGDLDEIADYIAADNPRRAVAFIRDIRAEFARIGQAPLLYQLRPDVGDDARLAVVGRHVIMFWIDGDIVRIERVVQGNRVLSVLYQ